MPCISSPQVHASAFMPIPPIWPFHRKQLKSRPPVKRPVSFSPVAVPSVTHPVGAGFLIYWDSSIGGTLSVTHIEEPDRVLWSTIPGECFITAAAGEESIRDKRGSISVADRIIYRCGNQTVEQIYATGRGEQRSVIVSGTLFSEPQCEAQSVKKAPKGEVTNISSNVPGHRCLCSLSFDGCSNVSRLKRKAGKVWWAMHIAPSRQI